MPGSGVNNDPFEWSNERLIQELCTNNRSWPAPPPKRWPDPDFLAAKLEEHDLDGQVLLCYEDHMGQGGFESLCADLGITKIPHKLSLRVAIRSFQNTSLGYRVWKASQATGDNNDPAMSEATMPSSPPPKETLTSAIDGKVVATPAIQNGDGHAKQAAPDPAAIDVSIFNSVLNGTSNGTTNGDLHLDAMQVDTSEPPLSIPFDRSKKRRRVMPTNISSAPRPRTARPDDSFGDHIDVTTASLGVGSDRLWQKSKKGAYMGDWSLTRYALLQGADPLGPNNDDDEHDVDSFGWAVPRPIPGGRRIQVHRTMQRYLQPSRPHVIQLGRSRTTQTGYSLGGVANPADEDEVLPALGESDDEGYDTETWEAMEQEAKERSEQNSQEEQKKRKNAPLSVETFDTVIADAIRDFETKWANKKLHKLRRREHQMWTTARRAGSRKYMMNWARKEADRFGQRIDKLVQEMRHVEWRNEKEIRLQAAVLDANIEDRQYALWEARLYSSPTAPQKVVIDRNASRRQSSVSRAARLRALEGDEEILTSSSSEDEDDSQMQNFIVNDEDGGRGRVVVDDDDNSTLSDGSMEVSDDEGSPEARSPTIDPEEREATKRLDEEYKPKVTKLAGFRNMEAVQGLLGSLAEDFPLEDLPAIVNKGVSYWETNGDTTRLLCTIFSSTDREQLSRLVGYCQTADVDAVWQKFCLPVIEHGGDPSAPRVGLEDDATAFTRYFYIFVTCRNLPFRDFNPRNDATREDITKSQGHLGKFCVKLRTLAPYFVQPRSRSTPPLPAQTIAAQPSAVPGPSVNRTGIEVVDIESDEDDEDDLDIYEVRPVAPQEEIDDDTEDDNDIQFSHSVKRRRRHVSKDQVAQDLRDKDKARHQEQEDRRKALYESLAQSGTLSQDQTRLIINTAKDKHHGIVYVNDWIGRNIRDHQVEGVRFMWNQIIAPPDSRQGCLLAHTMGLGKTMQVITLLVAIAEAAKSPDESISSQIPGDLKESKTLILCPSGLVENWQDELLAWAQLGTLGRAYAVTSSMYSAQRIDTVRQWSEKGGTLVLGYPMLVMLIKEFDDTIVELLEQTPNIVIADEAHTLKNPASRIHQLTRNFRTSARIAMTGSPLANSVEEYHSMINWVAPNYLAAKDEFRATYANPIREGFYRDSTKSQKRHAVKMLKVLKDTVAPKIHRATVASLQGVLPDKREFILYLPLTPLQLRVYKTFINLLTQPSMMFDINTTVQLWNTLVSLTLLLAHPKIFQMRLLEMKQPKQTGPRIGTLPLQMIDELLAAVNSRDIDSLDYSSKIMVLIGILDEAKRAGEKVLVFSQSKLVLDYLQTEFQRQKRRFRRLDGDTKVGRRQAMVKDFNVGDDEVYLISTTAGGVGLNIQGANRVVIFDFKWNPIHEQQAIGRAYRIGQTRRVFVYWLIIGGTFETVLHDQAVFKTQLASRVVDKKNPQAWADQMRNYTKDPEIIPVQPETATLYHGRDVVLDALLRPGAPTHDRICKIMSTDTFEQEEPEDTLTSEELTEAVNMVNLNKMRLRTGGGQEGSFQLVGAPGMGLPSTMPRFDRTQVEGASFPPTAASAAMARAAAMGRAGQTIPPSLVLASQSQQVGSNLFPSVYAYDAFLSQQAPLPMQIRTQNAADVAVHFTPPPPSVVPPSGHIDSDPFPDPVPEPPRPAPTPRAGSNSLAGSPEELVAAFKNALLDGSIVAQQCTVSTKTAGVLARRAVEEIESVFRLSGLPAKAHWGHLKFLINKVPGFAEVAVYGAVAPNRLASLTATEEREFLDRITGALAEIETQPAAYSLENTPNACALFGSRETLVRILERKLFERSWTSPKARKIISVARMQAHIVVQKITSYAAPALTRYAARAFRDPVFANAVASPGFNFEAWARMTPDEEADFVRNLHLRHMVEHVVEYPGHKGNLKIVYKADDSTPMPMRTTKAEPIDDASSTNTLNHIPSRPHSTAGRTLSFENTLSAVPPRPLGHVAHARGQGETRSDADATPSMRARDPDHFKHHLKRSQIRNHEAQDRGPVGQGRSEGGVPAREGRRRVGSSGAGSRDLLAMREVMERRERKTAVVPSPPAPFHAQVSQVPQQRPSPQLPQEPNMPPEWQRVANGNTIHTNSANMAQVAASQLHPPPHPAQSAHAAHAARSSSGAPAAPETPASFRTRGPPRIDPASQLQRGQMGRGQVERDLLEADRRQQSTKKDKTGGNKPRILPPPSRDPGPPGPQAGDNVRNPFVVD